MPDRKISSRALLAILPVILFHLAVNSQVHRQQNDTEESKKTIGKALRAFGRTLDFRSNFGNAYVKDRSLREKMMRSALFDQSLDAKTVNNLRGKTLERAFFAQENYDWLTWVYFFQEDATGNLISRDFDEFEKQIRRKAWGRLNTRQRVMYRQFLRDRNSYTTEEDRSFKSRTELLDWTGLMEQLGDALRSMIPRELRKQFNTPFKIDASPQPPGDFLGLKDRPSVYVSAQVKGVWGHFTFILVREQGEMRIANTVIHDGD